MASFQPPTEGEVRSLRHPLGLPAGSVRALLAFLVLGLIWSLVLMPPEKETQVPIYLYYLMFLILGHFFAAHGHTISGPSTGKGSPLHMPAGSLRFLIVAGFAAVLGWRYYRYGSLEELLKFDQPKLEEAYLPLALVGAFFVGIFSSKVLGKLFRGPNGTAWWYQDIQAWLALLATLGLVAEFIIHLVINPSLTPESRLYLPHWQIVLACITSYYFGARS